MPGEEEGVIPPGTQAAALLWLLGFDRGAWWDLTYREAYNARRRRERTAGLHLLPGDPRGHPGGGPAPSRGGPNDLGVQTVPDCERDGQPMSRARAAVLPQIVT